MTQLHPVYEALVSEWEAQLEALEHAIFRSLKRAMPGGRTRRELVYDVFGVVIAEGEDINNNTYDRKIRKTIEQMRENLIPIFSSSAESGYRLDISETSISMMVDEWQRRMEKYAEKVHRGRKLIHRIREVGESAIPERLPAKPQQFNLFG
jgi:hypothetical protein